MQMSHKLLSITGGQAKGLEKLKDKMTPTDAPPPGAWGDIKQVEARLKVLQKQVWMQEYAAEEAAAKKQKTTTAPATARATSAGSKAAGKRVARVPVAAASSAIEVSDESDVEATGPDENARESADEDGECRKLRS